MPPKINKISVNKETIVELTKSLKILIDSSSATGDGRGPGGGAVGEVDETDLNGVLNHLLGAVRVLTDTVQSMRGAVVGADSGGTSAAIEKRVRQTEDELDECRQRGLKGNLILTSLANNEKGKVCLIKTDEQLSQEGLSLTNHMIQLVKNKYDVVLPPSDIQACHRLPNKSVVLRLWNRKEDSAWSKIVGVYQEGGRTWSTTCTLTST